MNKKPSVLHIIMRISRIGSKALAISILGGVIAGFCNFLFAYLLGQSATIAIQQASNQVFDGKAFQVIFVIFLLSLPLQYLGQMLNLTGGLGAENNLKRTVISATLIHDEHEIKNGHTGDLMARLTSDADIVNDYYFQGLNHRVINPLVSGMASLVTIFTINTTLGIVSIAFGALSYFVATTLASRIQKAAEHARRFTTVSTKVISELLANEETIRLGNIKETILMRYHLANKDLAQANTKTETYTHTATALNESVSVLTQITYLGICALLTLNAGFDFADVLLLMSLQPNVSNAFGNLSASWNFFVSVSVAAQRMLEVIDTTQEDRRENKATLKINKETPPSLTFNNVSFSYTDDTNLFRNLNLSIPANQTIALVGESGSGKTTLFQLLLGLYNPQAGSIAIDKYNTHDYSLDSIRETMIYLQQEAPLFNRSIFENIALGSKQKNVSLDAVISAAKAANIHEFIQSLPLGYDTIVGESANQISGGQRQRIAIARAFMSDAPILILDEPTSALDSESEILIQDSLNRLASKKTVLIAAHRLSTIKGADHIVVLNQGSIAEQGTHQELMSNQGTYYRYTQYQSSKQEVEA